MPILFRLGPILARRICPAIEAAFPDTREAQAPFLRLYQATVLRYAADAVAAPVSTPVHQDFAFMTVTVPLNDPAEYMGGGTWIHELQRAVRPPAGHAIAHSGRVWHAGHPVTRGTRYALALFFHSSRFSDHGLRFYQRGCALIAEGRQSEACRELEFSFLAYKQAAQAARAQRQHLLPRVGGSAGDGEGHALVVEEEEEEERAEGQVVCGILSNLHLQLGNVAESARTELLFLKHVERLQRLSQGGAQHPALAGAMQNLDALMRRKSTKAL